jgi:cytoskeleton protein RodZ
MSDPDMSSQPANTESVTPPADGQDAAGAVLLRERRRQGLSLGDISRQLKLSVRQVEALERDDYSGYKGPVFIHGFIRNYAKLLGLDPEPLIRATDLMLNPPQVPAAAPREPERSEPVRTDQGRNWLWPTAVTLVVVGIVISAYFSAHRAPDAARSSAPVAARDKPEPSSKIVAEVKTGVDSKAKVEAKPEVESADRPTPKAEAKPEARPETKAETKARVEPAARASVEATEAIAAESSGRVTVRMIFEQESWVEIKDRAGNTIFGQLNPAGSRRSVSGEPPLSVVVGHSAGVRLFLGDKSIDLAPHTRVDVARLTLE